MEQERPCAREQAFGLKLHCSMPSMKKVQDERLGCHVVRTQDRKFRIHRIVAYPQRKEKIEGNGDRGHVRFREYRRNVRLDLRVGLACLQADPELSATSLCLGATRGDQPGRRGRAAFGFEHRREQFGQLVQHRQ
jgi:hypothetical protein